jgi:rubrerythrin
LGRKEENNMEDKEEKSVCAHCGYAASGKFVGDICPQCNQTYFKCAKCGFLITATIPPDTCPSCGEKCDFKNVTCYTPECGGPGHVDPRL